MDRLTKFYVHNLWWLGYISVKSPTITERSSLKTRLISLPGILNVFHCISTLTTFVVLRNTFQATEMPASNYMLLMMGLGVNAVAVILVRVISAKTSRDFLQTFVHLQHWAAERGRARKVRKIIWVMVALVANSTLCAMYMSVMILWTGIHAFRATGAALEARTVLYLAAYTSTVFTDVTAIPFAVSYVVILGSHIVDTYKTMSTAFLNNCQNAKEAWKVKHELKLLKRIKVRYYFAANFYCVCTVARCATALLKMFGFISTENTPYITLFDTVLLYLMVNLVSLALLAYAGNTFQTEVMSLALDFVF